MSRNVLVVAIGSFLATLATADYVLAGQPAWSPDERYLHGWEPITATLDGVVNSVYKHTVQPHDQGYLQYRCRSDGSSIGQCKRSIWDRFASSAGITVVNTHGGMHALAAVFSADVRELFDWADKDGDGKEDRHMSVWTHPEENRYYV